MFFVTLLNQCYWVAGATLGGLFGMALKFDTRGLDFVMTAMFVVILLEQWLKEKDHTSILTGLAVAVACLAIFGPDGFIIPSMAGILLALTLLRPRLEKEGGAA